MRAVALTHATEELLGLRPKGANGGETKQDKFASWTRASIHYPRNSRFLLQTNIKLPLSYRLFSHDLQIMCSICFGVIEGRLDELRKTDVSLMQQE